MKHLTKKAAIIGSGILLAGSAGTIIGLAVSHRDTSNDAVLLVKEKVNETKQVKLEIANQESEKEQMEKQENNNEIVKTVDTEQQDKTEIILWILGAGSVTLILLAACIVMTKKIRNMNKNVSYS